LTDHIYCSSHNDFNLIFLIYQSHVTQTHLSCPPHITQNTSESNFVVSLHIPVQKHPNSNSLNSRQTFHILVCVYTYIKSSQFWDI